MICQNGIWYVRQDYGMSNWYVVCRAGIMYDWGKKKEVSVFHMEWAKYGPKITNWHNDHG